MDLRAEILKEHSKAQSHKIADWVGNDATRFQQLFDLFLHGEQKIVQRSARMVSLVAETNPQLVQPCLQAMIDHMLQPGIHQAVKRNTVRTLQHIDIPEPLHGQVMNACFDFLADPQEDIAIRCFSMTVLDNLSRQYPDIRQELRAVIEDQLQHEATSAGFRSRAKKVLKIVR